MKTRKLAISDLSPYHRNARIGNVDAIAESLQINGQYKPIVVNEGTLTGRPWEILVGNHTTRAALQIGLEKLDAVVVDVDDEQARRIVLVDNRTSDLANYDEELLVELLETVGDLGGTGFTEADLEALEARVFSHDDGPRDLDALHGDVGDPTAEDFMETVKLALPADLAKRLTKYVGENHEESISALLEGASA